MDTFLSYIMLAWAVYFLGKRLYQSFYTKDCSKGCGCAKGISHKNTKK